MQIVESSDWALRVARLSLTSQRSAVRVTLFPMIHLGEPDFYRAVYADAFAHDVVLVEGVRSPITERITRAYRWLADSAKLNLVVQSAYPRPENGRARIVHADLSGVEFDKLWRTLPLALRVLVPPIATAVGLHGRWFLSREALAKRVESFEDFPTGRELLDLDPETGGLNRVVLQARDERLIARLLEQVDNPDPDVNRVAVVYGAHHMRAVLRTLTGTRGYRPDSSDWLTVFRL